MARSSRPCPGHVLSCSNVLPSPMRLLPVLPRSSPSENDALPGAELDGCPTGRPAATSESDVLAGLPREQVPWEKRVYFEVFGCQMNKLDAELMVGVLEDGALVGGISIDDLLTHLLTRR